MQCAPDMQYRVLHVNCSAIGAMGGNTYTERRTHDAAAGSGTCGSSLCGDARASVAQSCTSSASSSSWISRAASAYVSTPLQSDPWVMDKLLGGGVFAAPALTLIRFNRNTCRHSGSHLPSVWSSSMSAPITHSGHMRYTTGERLHHAAHQQPAAAAPSPVRPAAHQRLRIQRHGTPMGARACVRDLLHYASRLAWGSVSYARQSHLLESSSVHYRVSAVVKAACRLSSYMAESGCGNSSDTRVSVRLMKPLLSVCYPLII